MFQFYLLLIVFICNFCLSRLSCLNETHHQFHRDFFLMKSYSAWRQVRDDKHIDVDWLIAGYVPGSKTDVTVIHKGCGGLEACAKALPSGQAVFGGLRHRTNRFVTFWYCDDATPTMQKGRASLHKNGMSFESDVLVR
jgi:hypothetical protein